MSTQKVLNLLAPNNGEWQLEDKVIPKPGPGHLLVKQYAVGLNPIDWGLRAHPTGLFIRKFPATLGVEGAGEVVEVGAGVSNYAKGDRIMYQADWTIDGGTFQQYMIVSAERDAIIPPGVSYEQAASIPCCLATAAVGLYGKRNEPAAPRFTPAWEEGGKGKYAGKPIVVLGGSSSVGQYTLQLARLSGFSPIISTSSPHNFDLLKKLGATHALDRNSESIRDDILSTLNGAVVEIVYDCVNASELGFEVASPGAIVFNSGHNVADLRKFPGIFHQFRAATVHLPDLQQLGASLFGKVPELLQSGELVPNKVQVLPGGLSAVARGAEMIRLGENSATKLIVNPADTPI